MHTHGRARNSLGDYVIEWGLCSVIGNKKKYLSLDCFDRRIGRGDYAGRTLF